MNEGVRIKRGEGRRRGWGEEKKGGENIGMGRELEFGERKG